MTFQTIRILLVAGLLIVQIVPAQDQLRVSGGVALAQQNPQDKKADRPDASENSTTPKSPAEDPLITLLVGKGLLTTDEARTVSSAGSAADQRDRLASLLKDKGLISAAEFDQ